MSPNRQIDTQPLQPCCAVALLFLLQQKPVARLEKLSQLRNGLPKRMVQMQKEQPSPRIKVTPLRCQNSRAGISKGAVRVINLKEVFQPTRPSTLSRIFSAPSPRRTLQGRSPLVLFLPPPHIRNALAVRCSHVPPRDSTSALEGHSQRGSVLTWEGVSFLL